MFRINSQHCWNMNSSIKHDKQGPSWSGNYLYFLSRPPSFSTSATSSSVQTTVCPFPLPTDSHCRRSLPPLPANQILTLPSFSSSVDLIVSHFSWFCFSGLYLPDITMVGNFRTIQKHTSISNEIGSHTISWTTDHTVLFAFFFV